MAVTAESWLDSQYSVLGSVLISPEVAPKVLSETEPTDFSGACRTVYDAISSLFTAGEAVDVVAVNAALGKRYQDFLVQLMEITPTAANIDHYIRITREQSRVLTIRDLAHQITDTEDLPSARKLLEQANGLLIDRPSARVANMEQTLRSFMERHTRQVDYLTWPIPEFDGVLFAEPGDFIVFGGRPSTGKSAFVLQCAWHWAQKTKVGFFSLETSAEKLFDRLMSGVARVPMDNIKRNTMTDANWAAVMTKNPEILSRNLEIIHAAGMSVSDIRAKTVMEGYKLIIVDYLQLIQSSGENRTAQVTNISIGLHTLAQSLGVTVVALSQLARQNPMGGALGMGSLRESGQIEQDADVVMLLSLKNEQYPSGPRILKIAKNKEGTCPAICLAFDGKYQTFSKARLTDESMDEPEPPDRSIVRPTGIHPPDAGEAFSYIPDDDPQNPWNKKGKRT